MKQLLIDRAKPLSSGKVLSLSLSATVLILRSIPSDGLYLTTPILYLPWLHALYHFPSCEHPRDRLSGSRCSLVACLIKSASHLVNLNLKHGGEE